MQLNIPGDKIKEIADHLDMGMKCFYHLTTGEVEFYPDELKGGDLYDEEAWEDVIDKVEKNNGEYIAFEGMDSSESFNVMENFVADIKEENIRQRFEDAIAYKKPFQNFKQLLANYPELRQQWFRYKDQEYIDFVEQQVASYNLMQEE